MSSDALAFLRNLWRPSRTDFTDSAYLPSTLADAIELEKGEEFEWVVEDKNTLVLNRCEKRPMRKKGRTSA